MHTNVSVVWSSKKQQRVAQLKLINLQRILFSNHGAMEAILEHKVLDYSNYPAGVHIMNSTEILVGIKTTTYYVLYQNMQTFVGLLPASKPNKVSEHEYPS